MCSIFQHPFFPYSGDAPMGPNMVNVPMKAGSSGAEFRKVVEDIWLPRLLEFQPQILFISAGFDAHREDEMGSMGLVEADYERLRANCANLPPSTAKAASFRSWKAVTDLSASNGSATAHQDTQRSLTAAGRPCTGTRPESRVMKNAVRPFPAMRRLFSCLS